MSREPSEPLWPAASRRALAELLERVRRTVLAYREAERVVQDHRVQAAIYRLRLDHERHAAEMAELLGSMEAVQGGVGELAASDASVTAIGAPEPATGPAPDPDGAQAVHELLARGEASGAALLSALRRVERVLHAAYAGQAEIPHPEAVRVVLARHRRVEEAHVDWVHDSPIWPAGAVPESQLGPLSAVPHGHPPNPSPPTPNAP
ncbi:MAG TPA: hypothetical protein VKZ58_03220 [Longimicrobiales bacterium]|nr:hypothetical protein [Longimicrobiales bacterium]